MINKRKKLYKQNFSQEIFTEFHIFEDFLRKTETFLGNREF